MGPEKNRRDPRLIPIIDEAGMTATRVTITFTRDSMQGVFDDLYEAKIGENVVDAKRQGKTPPKPGQSFLSKTDPETGELKQVLGFAYDDLVPQSPCLTSYMDKSLGQGWLSLWRRMLWSIPAAATT